MAIRKHSEAEPPTRLQFRSQDWSVTSFLAFCFPVALQQPRSSSERTVTMKVKWKSQSKALMELTHEENKAKGLLYLESHCE